MRRGRLFVRAIFVRFFYTNLSWRFPFEFRETVLRVMSIIK